MSVVRVPDRVPAPAKINLFLRILGRRPDGYHNLETVVLPIGFGDVLEVRAAADPAASTMDLSLRVEGSPELTGGVPTDDSNLVLRAARALADRTGVRGFAEITLEKVVPSAAGLGGGSADAAATLRALNERWGCGLDDDTLRAVAAEVGSDVPALVGGGPCLVRGRGERVLPVVVPRLTWLLVTFAFGVPTADAFDWWDAEPVTGPDPGDLLAAAAEAASRRVGEGDRETRGSLGMLPFNDLEQQVVRRHPIVGKVLDILLDKGASSALLAGSGPSVVGLFERDLGNQERLGYLASSLQALTGLMPRWVVSPASDLPPRDAGG